MHGVLAPDWLDFDIEPNTFLVILRLELAPHESLISRRDWFSFVIDEVFRFAPTQIERFVNAADDYLAVAVLEFVSSPQEIVNLAERLGVNDDEVIRRAVLRRLWTSEVTFSGSSVLRSLVEKWRFSDSRSGALSLMLDWRNGAGFGWRDVVAALEVKGNEFQEELLDEGHFFARILGAPNSQVVALVAGIAQHSPSDATRQAAADALLAWQ